MTNGKDPRPIPREGDCDVILDPKAPLALWRSSLRLQRPVVIRNPECTEPREAHIECEWKQGITVCGLASGRHHAGASSLSHRCAGIDPASRRNAHPSALTRRRSRRRTGNCATTRSPTPPSKEGVDSPATSGSPPPLTSGGLLMEG